MIPRWSPYYPACGYYPPGYIPGGGGECTPWVVPTVAQFQTQFFRDWEYAPVVQGVTDPSLKYIQNQDIQNAINIAVNDFNPQYGPNNTVVFLYLAAHYMVMGLRNSSMGLNSQAKFPQDSATVGGVTVSNNIVERFANDANFAKYLTTGYGQLYLSMVYPYTVGAGIGIIPGQQTSA